MLSFWRSSNKEVVPPKTPEDTTIYAVGDVHGYADLLDQLHQKIADHARKHPTKHQKVIYVGDYIDRGVQSKQVIDLILSNPLPNFEVVCLRGNHEQAMLDFMDNPEKAAAWLGWGGEATLQSYEVPLRDKKGMRLSFEVLGQTLSAKLPQTHLSFLQSLPYYHIEGDYCFVHAGLRPKIPLAKQTPHDMMTIREGFIKHKHQFEHTVVFGHTIFDTPYTAPGRIGIDTGAYANGTLTALVLSGQHQEFIHAHTENTGF